MAGAEGCPFPLGLLSGGCGGGCGHAGRSVASTRHPLCHAFRTVRCHELLGQHESEDWVPPLCRRVAPLGMAQEQVSSSLGLKEVEIFALFCVNSDPAPPSLPPVRPMGNSKGGIPPWSLPLPRDPAVDFQPLFNFLLGFFVVSLNCTLTVQ